MRIKEMRVFKYGPLGDTGNLKFRNFTILWGENEKGKTMLVDALLKMILKSRKRNKMKLANLFDGIDRVDEFPDGYVVISYKGKEYKLPDVHLPVEIPPEDFRNIFVIRDSDLLILREGDYLSNLTQRLTGSKVNKINGIIKNLRGIGNITGTGRYENKADSFYLGKRINEADTLLNEIDELLKKLESLDYENLELEIFSKKRELEIIQAQLEKLDLARKREKYEKGKRWLNELNEKLSEIAGYEKYDKKDVEEWMNLQKKFEDKKDLLKEIKKNLEKNEKRKYNLKEQIEMEKEELNKYKNKVDLVGKLKEFFTKKAELEIEYESCVDNLRKKQGDLEALTQKHEEVKNKLNYMKEKNIEERIKKLKESETDTKISKQLKRINRFIPFLILLALAIVIAGIFIRGFMAPIGIIGGLIIAGVSLFKMIMYEKEIKKLREEDSWENLIREITPIFEGENLNKENVEYQVSSLKSFANDIEIKRQTVGNLVNEQLTKCETLKNKLREKETGIKELTKILGIGPEEYHQYAFKIEEKYKDTNNSLERVIGELKSIEERIEELESQKSELEKQIREITHTIQSLKDKYGVESYVQLRGKLEEKGNIEGEIKEIRGKLSTLFSYSTGDLKEEIHFFAEELRKLEIFKSSAQDIEYSNERWEELRSREDKLKNEIEELQNRINFYADEFKKIEMSVNDILRSEEPEKILSPLQPDDIVKCRGISDLKNIKEKLLNFVEANEERRKGIQLAIDIFTEIRREEEERIAALFGEDSDTIKYFEDITDGLYMDVNYNADTHEIKVVRRDNIILSTRQLSGGALDQLYFSIRLSLAKKILNDKGFFILDDPFIKADPIRLKRLFNILKNLADEGWQILYFSSKDEIQDLYNKEYSQMAELLTIDFVHA